VALPRSLPLRGADPRSGALPPPFDANPRSGALSPPRDADPRSEVIKTVRGRFADSTLGGAVRLIAGLSSTRPRDELFDVPFRPNAENGTGSPRTRDAALEVDPFFPLLPPFSLPRPLLDSLLPPLLDSFPRPLLVVDVAGGVRDPPLLAGSEGLLLSLAPL